MNVGKDEFIKKYKESRPAVSSFAECISRAYLTGVAGFALAFSSTYITQSLLKKKITYSFPVQMSISLAVGAGVAYKVSQDRFKICQASFLSAEGTTTYFTQLKPDDNEP